MSKDVKKILPIEFNIGPGTHELLQCAWFPERLGDLEEAVKQEEPNVVYGGVRALDVAVLNQNIEAVKKLLALGADPLLKNTKNYETTVSLAIKMGNFTILDCLLKTSEKVLEQDFGLGNTMLHQAVMANNSDLILHLIQSFPSLLSKKNNRGNTAIMQATRYVDMETFQAIYKAMKAKGVNIFETNHAGWGVFTFAVHNKQETLINFLKVKRIPKSEMKNGCHEAIMTQQWGLMVFLLERIKLPVVEGKLTSQQLLFRALIKGNEKKVLAYKSAGFALDEANEVGHQGLFYAVLGGHTQVVDTFANLIGDWSKGDTDGTTPAHMLFAFGKQRLFEVAMAQPLFRQQEAELMTVKNQYDETPSHYAHYFSNEAGFGLVEEALARDTSEAQSKGSAQGDAASSSARLKLSQRSTKDKLGATPLFWKRRREVLQELLSLSLPYWQARFVKPQTPLPNFSLSDMDALENTLKSEAKFIKDTSMLSPIYMYYLTELTAILSELHGIVKNEVIPEHQSEDKKDELLEKLNKLLRLIERRLKGKE